MTLPARELYFDRVKVLERERLGDLEGGSD